MSSPLDDPQAYLDSAQIAPEVFALQPSYRALLIIASNIPPSSSPTSDRPSSDDSILSIAEHAAKVSLVQTPLSNIPHVTAWRSAYKSFGAKPKKTKNSLEALLSRVDAGIPRINRLTDIYNAVSIKHQIPIGGEDLDKYIGAPRLIRADGTEKFVTRSGGEDVVEFPKEGEVVWCDEGGVTCRLWNWRQCARTALSGETRNVLFILDALEPCGDEALEAAGEELCGLVEGLGSEVRVWRRVVGKV